MAPTKHRGGVEEEVVVEEGSLHVISKTKEKDAQATVAVMAVS